MGVLLKKSSIKTSETVKSKSSINKGRSSFLRELNVTILTKEQVENERRKAYSYLA